MASSHVTGVRREKAINALREAIPVVMGRFGLEPSPGLQIQDDLDYEIRRALKSDPVIGPILVFEALARDFTALREKIEAEDAEVNESLVAGAEAVNSNAALSCAILAGATTEAQAVISRVNDLAALRKLRDLEAGGPARVALLGVLDTRIAEMEASNA